MTKSLSKAIALATLVGATASAQAAVSVNTDGLGEVLLYSVYTVEEGNITNINITNTTNQTKAVKVRFLEGQNSHEVLDFNLYLSPFDQWTGAVTATADGAQLITADKSCTLPAIGLQTGVPFRDLEYVGDGGEQSLARTRVGHFEAIEMGVFRDNAPANLVNAVANKDCNVLDAAFAKGGFWENDPTAGLRAGPSTGGLYGTAEIMNVNESTVISYDALALEGLLLTGANAEDPVTATGGSLHVRPGTIYPNLNGNIRSPIATDVVLNQSPSRTSNMATIDGVNYNFPSTIQAISAVLAKTDIHNNYVIDEGRASKSNWVVTFPTKRFHVDPTMENGLGASTMLNYAAFIQTQQANVTAATNALNDALAGTDGAAIVAAQNALVIVEKALADRIAEYAELNIYNIAPFTEFWNAGQACEDINLSAWDNDERVKTDLDFSPSRPTGPQLCYETNILTFNDGKVLGGEFVSQNIDLDPTLFPYGWMNVDFSSHLSVVADELDFHNPRDVRIVGLPVIGFSAANFRNNEAKAGINNIYTSSSNHKATKGVVVVPTP